jgi:hypothetical protein
MIKAGGIIGDALVDLAYGIPLLAPVNSLAPFQEMAQLHRILLRAMMSPCITFLL